MSQTEKILAHLRTGRTITAREALRDYGCFRLGARIFELKRAGYAIAVSMEFDTEAGKHFASYRLAARQIAA